MLMANPKQTSEFCFWPILNCLEFRFIVYARTCMLWCFKCLIPVLGMWALCAQHLILLLISMAAGAVVSSSPPQPTLPLIREGRPSREQEIILTEQTEIPFSIKLLVCHYGKWTDTGTASVTPVSQVDAKRSWKAAEKADPIFPELGRHPMNPAS